MRFKSLVLGIAVAGLFGASGLLSEAVAQESVFVPLLTYRTGPFSNSGIPIANGTHDYLDMLNARDGGIGGAKIIVEECETGYDTNKGVQCWESIKGKHATVVNPFSTGITLQLIPKASVDHKIKKEGGPPEIVLEPTPDILAGLGSVKRPGQILVGFAAETEALHENATSKLRRKHLDLIVANDVSKPGAGFEHDTNEVVILGEGIEQNVSLTDKRVVARAVFDAVMAIRTRRTPGATQ